MVFLERKDHHQAANAASSKMLTDAGVEVHQLSETALAAAQWSEELQGFIADKA